jgi:hypothetical protein
VGLEALSAQHRPLGDLLEVQEPLPPSDAEQPLAFSELVAATDWPVVVRAHVLRLLRHRRPAVRPGEPPDDRSSV